MKVMGKMNKNLRLGLSLLMGATLVLGQACGKTDEGTGTKGKEDEGKITYKVLTFVDKPVAGMAGKNKAVDYTAIGRNGDGSDIYFGVEGEGGVLGVFDLATVKHLNMTAAKTDEDKTNPAQYNFTLGGGLGADNARVTKIDPGPGAEAVIAVSGLGGYKLSLTNHAGGVLEVKGGAILGGWRNTKELFTDLNSEHNDVSALLSVQNKWMAFFEDASSAAAAGTFEALKPTVAGLKGTPGPGLGKVVTAAVNSGNLVYLATTDGEIFRYDASTTNKVDFSKGALVTLSDKGITSLAVIDGKLLAGHGKVPKNQYGLGIVRGFLVDDNSKGVSEVDLGSLAIRKINSDSAVQSIGMSLDGKFAFFGTDKGPLFYINSTLIGPVKFADGPQEEEEDGMIFW